MADINTNAEGNEPIGALHVKILPDFDGFTEALEKGLSDAEGSTSPLIAILTRIEEHLRVIASAHEPATIKVDGRRVIGALRNDTTRNDEEN